MLKYVPLHISPENYYKDNYRREGIRVANARPKVIIFCKSRWDLVTLQWFYAVRAFRRRMFCTVNRISCCEWFTNFDDGWNNSDTRRSKISPLIWNIFHCTGLNFSYPWEGIHKFQWTSCTIFKIFNREWTIKLLQLKDIYVSLQ